MRVKSEKHSLEDTSQKLRNVNGDGKSGVHNTDKVFKMKVFGIRIR